MTGIIRRIDELGRIVIPKEIRRVYGLNTGDSMEIFIGDNGQIILQKYQKGCMICGRMDHTKQIDNVILCEACIEKFNK